MNKFSKIFKDYLKSINWKTTIFLYSISILLLIIDKSDIINFLLITLAWFLITILVFTKVLLKNHGT